MHPKVLGFVRNNAVGLIALFIALGGTAYAVSGGFVTAGGTFHACVRGDGSIRLVKAGRRCQRGEQAVTWNRVGPKGASGPAGPTGAAGQNGINGTNGSNGADGTNAATKVVVRTTTVAPGGAGGGFFNGSVQCDVGERATGGGAGRGAGQPTSSTDRVARSFPINAAGNEAAGGETPTGWSVAGDTTGLGGNVAIHVVCISP